MSDRHDDKRRSEETCAFAECAYPNCACRVVPGWARSAVVPTREQLEALPHAHYGTLNGWTAHYVPVEEVLRLAIPAALASAPSTGGTREAELADALREATAIGIASLFAYCGAYESLSPHKKRQWDRLSELAKLAGDSAPNAIERTGQWVGTIPAEESDEEFARQVEQMDSPQSHVGASEDAALTYKAFWDRHAKGSLACPSCLLCGRQRAREQWQIKHAELPDIYICAPCVDAARSSTVPNASKFVTEWLFEPDRFGHERKTRGMPWTWEYTYDAARMCEAFARSASGANS